MSKIFKFTIGEMTFDKDGNIRNVIGIRDGLVEEYYELDNNTVFASSELYTFSEYCEYKTNLLNEEIKNSTRFLEKYGNV